MAKSQRQTEFTDLDLKQHVNIPFKVINLSESSARYNTHFKDKATPFRTLLKVQSKTPIHTVVLTQDGNVNGNKSDVIARDTVYQMPAQKQKTKFKASPNRACREILTLKYIQTQNIDLFKSRQHNHIMHRPTQTMRSQN